MKHTWTVQLNPSYRAPWLARLTPALVMGGYKYNFIKFKRPLKSETKMDIYPDAPVNDGDVYAMGTSNPRTEDKSKCYGIYTKANGWKWFPTLADLKGGTMLGVVLPCFVLPTSYSYSPDDDEVPVVHETRADGTVFRVLQVGETTRYGDFITSKENPFGLGICPIESYLSNIKVTAGADFRFLRPLAAMVSFQEHIPLQSNGYPPLEYLGAQALRVLAINEAIVDGDYMSSISNKANKGIVPCSSDIVGGKVLRTDALRFLRPVSPPPLNPTPTPPAKKGNPIADLADYWLFKYKDACEDDEERAVWERVLETLK